MVSSASSQLMRSKSPEPRAPTRFMGYSTRFAPYMRPTWVRPFVQMRLYWGSGMSRAEVRTTWPSRTCTFRKHPPPQLPRQVPENNSSDDTGASGSTLSLSLVFGVQPASAPAAVRAAAPLMKLLREKPRACAVSAMRCSSLPCCRSRCAQRHAARASPGGSMGLACGGAGREGVPAPRGEVEKPSAFPWLPVAFTLQNRTANDDKPAIRICLIKY